VKLYLDIMNTNVEVRIISEKKNRGLVAKQNIAQNEVIFSEEPLVAAQFTWNEFYQYKACEYCMRPLETTEENIARLTEDRNFKLQYLKEICSVDKSKFVECPSCHLSYCSEECRQNAFNSYHQTLCLGKDRFNENHPLNQILELWKQVHLPPETTTIMLVFKLVAIIKQSQDKNAIIQKLLKFESNLTNGNMKHKLIGENFFYQIEFLRKQLNEIFINYLYVKECEPLFSEYGFKQLFGLIGRNSQGIGTSPLSEWVNKCTKSFGNDKSKLKQFNKYIDKLYDRLDKYAGQFLNSEGSALYELQSCANHSCIPNAEIVFPNNNNVVSLKALRDIQQGEEITISYLDECSLTRSRHSRQKILKENYLFLCDCEKCLNEANQKEETSDEDDEDMEDYDDDNDSDSEDENNNLMTS
jgi:SET and MYND domain-containing protein 5